jgi:TRAP-type C4-dicarboxylate transport system permease small subunit
LQPRVEAAALPAPRASIVAVPRLVVGALLLLAIGVMLVGVFLRYVMVPITDELRLDPVNFFRGEELGELLLAWMTLVGAAVGIAERTHFTVTLIAHHLPAFAQRVIHIANHVLIATFGGVIAWQGWQVAALNKGLTSPALGISMGWLYGALVGGGTLIALFALGMVAAPATAVHHVVE